MSVSADLAYAGALGAKPEWHTARLTVPAGVGPFPVFVYLHGGFWKPQWDRAATASHMVTDTFTGAGEATPSEDAEASLLGKVAILDVEYSRVDQDEPERSAGGGGWPGTYLDALAALNALAAAQRAAFAEESGDGKAESSESSVSASVRAAAARVDLHAVVLSGHSAGGAMALWLGMFSSLPPTFRCELGETIRATCASAAAQALSAGVDASVRILGVVALAPVADLAMAGREGISDFHDAIPNLFWRCTNHRDRTASVRAACPTALMRQGLLPPFAHTPHFLLIHGDRDVDVPPFQSFSFAASAWATPGDHPTWLMLLRELDHLEVAGIGVDASSGSEAAQRWRTVQRAMRLFFAAVIAAERAISPAGTKASFMAERKLPPAAGAAIDGDTGAVACSTAEHAISPAGEGALPTAERELSLAGEAQRAASATPSRGARGAGAGTSCTAESELSALCCTSIDDARDFCSRAKPHVCATATVAAIEAVASDAGAAAEAALEALEQKFSPRLLARGLGRWLEWNDSEPRPALAAWLAEHAQKGS
jgi:hypothetical protein